MPSRSCFSQSCEFNFMKYLFKDWNLLQKTTKIVGFFQDTTYNHRCLANPFLLLQSLYSLKMALSSAFPFASALYMPVLYHLKKKKKEREIVLSILTQVPYHPEGTSITNHLQRQGAMQIFLTLSVWSKTFTGPPVFPEDGIHSAQNTKSQHFW